MSITLRISVTDRCNLACKYCMPSNRSSFNSKPGILSFKEILTFVEIAAHTYDINKIKITGGEPLLRTELDVFIKELVGMGIKDVSLTTNGQLLANYSERLAKAGLKRVNVSLDSLKDSTFRFIAGKGKRAKTLKGIEAAQAAGLKPIKINCVVMRNKNFQEIHDILLYCRERQLHLRFLELMPIGPAAALCKKELVNCKEVKSFLESTGYEFTPGNKACGEVASNYSLRFPDKGVSSIGFISSSSGSFCQGCRRLRLSSTGTLVPCLKRNFSVEIGQLLREGDNAESQKQINKHLAWALTCKTGKGGILDYDRMVGIGG